MKKRKTQNVLFALLCSFLLAMTVGSASLPLSAEGEAKLVDVSKKYQTFDGWGTSLAWWADAVGSWTMQGASGKEKREEIMDLVFSPEGLDINIVRYNLGGGDDPSHNHMIDNRNMFGYKTSADAPYDFTADARQRWVLKQANEMREGNIINELFVNSPPYYMTESGCSSGGATKAKENLAVENYDQFLTYVTDVLKFLVEEEGIGFDYIEPLNEPGSDYWGANGSQEGNKVTPEDHQSLMYTKLAAQLAEKGLQDVMMTGVDETSTMLTLSSFNALSEEAKALLTKINAHTYSFNESSKNELKKIAYGETPDYDDPAYKIWMSEVCYGSAEADDHDSMAFSMDMSRDITQDILKMGASAWVVWQAVESELSNLSYGNNYGLIHGIYQDVDNVEYGIDMDSLALSRGDYYVSKQYYTMGQYSKYIKEGYRIVDSGDAATVAALSPDGKKLVLVVRNDSDQPAAVDYTFKNFMGESAKKIVTDPTKNWQETDITALGGLRDKLDANSVTTYVIDGAEGIYNTASDVVQLKNAVSYGTNVRVQYAVDTKTGADYGYKLYYTKNKSELLAITPETPNVSLDTEKTTAIVADLDLDSTYYFMIAADKTGESLTSGIVSARAQNTAKQDFVYFIDGGAAFDFDNSVASYSASQSAPNQKFGTDALTGKKWGYTTSNVGTYEGSMWGGAVYSNVETLEYKLQVDDGTTEHFVTLGFIDPWKVSGRATDIFINGGSVADAFVEDTIQRITATVGGVKGVQDGDGYFITVTMAKRAGNKAGSPVLNFMTVQRESADELILDEVNADIFVTQGQTVLNELPSSVQVATTKGIKTYNNVIYDRLDYSMCQTANTSTRVKGKIAGTDLTVSVNVFIRAAGEEYFYYIDCAHTVPGSGNPNYQAVWQMHAATLLNNTQLDQASTGSGVWGYVGKTGDYWTNNADFNLSLREGQTDKTLTYNLPGLPAGEYDFVLGFKEPNWSGRTMKININGVEKSSVTLTGDWDEKTVTFKHTVTTDGEETLLNVVGQGGNAHMGSAIVKKSIGAPPDAQAPAKPVLPSKLNSTDTAVTVGELTEGAILTLTDDKNNCIIEYTVGAGETSKNFSGLDLTGCKSVKAVQYKDFKKSPEALCDVPLLVVSAPRTVWSGDDDVIKVDVSSINGVDGVAVKLGDGEYTDIKSQKFFRAKQNGEYTVRLTTKAGDAVTKTVTVDRVDFVTFDMITDLNVWVGGDLGMTVTADATSGVKTIKANGTDITNSLDQGTYRYTASDNGKVTFAVETLQGVTKTYDYTVSTIDKQAPKMDIALKSFSGVAYADFSVTSLAPYEITVKSGENTQDVYDGRFVFTHGGEYVFTVKNEAGNSASKTVKYASKLSGSQHLTVAAGAVTDTSLTLDIAAKATGVRDIALKKIDGTQKDIAIADGKAVLTENGTYMLTSVDQNGVTETLTFTVDSVKNQNTITGGGVVKDNALGALGGGLIAAGAVAVACGAAILVLFLLNRKNAKRGV